MPRSLWAALCVPRASSQTEPGVTVIAASVRALGSRDVFGLAGRLAGGPLDRRPQRRKVSLDLCKALVQRGELATQVVDRLDRRRAEPLGLAAEVAELAVQDELDELAEEKPEAREQDRRDALGREGDALLERDRVHAEPAGPTDQTGGGPARRIRSSSGSFRPAIRR